MSDKVMVAMSGGVDSTAAVILLRNSGYDVAGATMRLCTDVPSEESMRMAQDAASKLGISHFVYELSDVFRHEVMDYFAHSYINGETPNPCVMCNAKIKFPAFMKESEKYGYKKIATGHYVRSEYDMASGRWLLKKGKDPYKDQSYFLWGLTQEYLARSVFPLGNMTKQEVKVLAESLNLEAARGKESQDVCFLPDGDYMSFIEREYNYESIPGDFVDKYGNVLGKHGGAASYTIGQRRGLGVSSSGRLYVVGKKNNTVRLGEEAELYSKSVNVKDVNLIAVSSLSSPIKVEAKLRYSKNTAEALLVPSGEKTAVLEFTEGQRAATIGQSAVFYDGDTVIGGGIIAGLQCFDNRTE